MYISMLQMLRTQKIKISTFSKKFGNKNWKNEKYDCCIEIKNSSGWNFFRWKRKSVLSYIENAEKMLFLHKKLQKAILLWTWPKKFLWLPWIGYFTKPVQRTACCWKNAISCNDEDERYESYYKWCILHLFDFLSFFIVLSIAYSAIFQTRILAGSQIFIPKINFQRQQPVMIFRITVIAHLMHFGWSILLSFSVKRSCFVDQLEFIIALSLKRRQ